MTTKDKSKPDINVNNSPNAVVQINNSGNNIINQNLPEPKFTLEQKEINNFSNGIYITKALLTIDSKVALKNLYLEAHSKSIIDFDVSPQRSGVFMTGHSGKRDGFIFTNLPGAYGTYELIIKSTQNEIPNIIYNYE
jgi:hypothetical protein